MPEPVDESRSYKYELKGMILHFGTFRGGHYKAICREGEGWWCLNDKISEKVNIASALSNPETQKSLYVLLYERLGR